MNITYNFGQIADTSAAINSFQGQMDQQLNDLYTAFTQLFAQDWTGAAGTACDEARQKWNQGATEIKQALASVGVKLGASAERMQQVDAQIAANM
ncbi:WXG100 family type VII secretion target [Actinoplanes xinjiangensis]|uniref:WXG100 family type VII secretion target n=1 Tax=Actinoplanes xinjiangensis TaxID=512350 RepID=UPI00341518C9